MSDVDVVVIGGGAAGPSAGLEALATASPPGLLTTPLTPGAAARMVARAAVRRAARTQRGSSAGTPAIAGTGSSRRAERSS